MTIIYYLQLVVLIIFVLLIASEEKIASEFNFGGNGKIIAKSILICVIIIEGILTYMDHRNNNDNI